MDDIQFAFSVSDKLGQLYRNAKTFSGQAPALSLAHLRGLAYEVCSMLDRGASSGEPLATRIRSVESTGLLKSPAIRRLRILQRHGNVAAHPEEFNHETHNFGAMATEALTAARDLLEQLLVLRGDPVPTYSVDPVQDSGLRDMCYQAMVLGDIDAIHQVGEYFKAQAVQLSEDRTGEFTADGYSFNARDQIEQAMFWFKKGADHNHPACMYQYGAYHFFSQDADDDQLAKARWYITRGCEAGEVEAMVLVAGGSLTGEGGFAIDEAYARDLYEQAAGHNHPGALAQLGAIYALGTGCEVDLESAAKYTIRAAEAGFPLGQYNLFALYLNGIGVGQDVGLALKWLQEAAAQDFPEAIFNLAVLIHKGDVPGRVLADAAPLYHQLAGSEQYRAHGALGLAQITLELEDNLEGWIKAASYAMSCYQVLSTEEDPDQLLDECLAAGKRAVTKVRHNIQEQGPSKDGQGSDLLACWMYDKDGVPVSNWESRRDDFYAVVMATATGSPKDIAKATERLLQEACISVPKASRSPIPTFLARPPLPEGPKAGRNDPCPCGSGQKYKKCHGA